MIARRAQAIQPFLAMEILERAQALERQGEAIIHLEVGEPDFPTPSCVQEAALKALRDGRTKYTHSQGTPELRNAICEHYLTAYGVSLTPDQILVTAGTSPAMWLLFSALLEPGEEVILSNPHYPCYPNFIRIAEGTPVFAEVFEEEGFQLEPQAVRDRIRPNTKAILLNSPANPTGAVLSADRVKALAALSPWIVSDEIYHGLTYEGKAHSILEFTDHAIVVNGFSKTYAMTGWRLGYVIAPKPLIRQLRTMHQNFFISASDFVQAAGVAALREAGPDVERMRRLYDERRRMLIRGLRALGFGVTTEPQGAFYVLANAQRFSNDSAQLASELLEQAKVGVTPGIDFGARAEGYLRFSYANSLENLEEALKRIGQFLTA